MNLVEIAAQMCLKYHEYQTDKSGTPYFWHPFSVAMKVESDPEKIVALLHDTLEDTDCEYEEIEQIFGKEIADAVLILTHDKKEDTYLDYIKKIPSNHLALSVKKADLKHNISKCGDKKEFASLKKRYVNALKYLEDYV